MGRRDLRRRSKVMGKKRSEKEKRWSDTTSLCASVDIENRGWKLCGLHLLRSLDPVGR